VADKFITPLAEGATNMHELYLSWLAAGFTEAQAMQLVSAFMVEAVRMGVESNNANPSAQP
jgi:hypothetical protein